MNQGVMPSPNPAASLFRGGITIFDDQVISGSGISRVRFQNIPQTVNHLQLIYKAKGTVASSHLGVMYLMINQNSEAIYNWENVWAQATTASRDYLINQVHHLINYCATNPAANIATASGQILFPFYTDNKLMHRYIAHSAYQNTIAIGSCAWEKLEAISDLEIYTPTGGGNYFVPGSRFTLYGLI